MFELSISWANTKSNKKDSGRDFQPCHIANNLARLSETGWAKRYMDGITLGIILQLKPSCMLWYGVVTQLTCLEHEKYEIPINPYLSNESLDYGQENPKYFDE